MYFFFFNLRHNTIFLCLSKFGKQALFKSIKIHIDVYHVFQVVFSLFELKIRSIITRLNVPDGICHVINRLHKFSPFRVFNQISHQCLTSTKSYQQIQKTNYRSRMLSPVFFYPKTLQFISHTACHFPATKKTKPKKSFKYM